MSPQTWQDLGFPALRQDQADRVQAQQRAIAAGQYPKWPESAERLEMIQRTPLPEAVELDPDSGWAQWDLAVKLADAKRDERNDADCMEAAERREWVRL